MNREIKFRAWDDIQKMMHDWDYLKGWTFRDIQKQGDCVHLMQFTGLKDKNGKEIYEGDVWENEIHKFVVAFGGYRDDRQEDIETHHGWYVSLIPEDGIAGGEKYPLAPGTDGVVIGNIWENAELLTSKE